MTLIFMQGRRSLHKMFVLKNSDEKQTYLIESKKQ